MTFPYDKKESDVLPEVTMFAPKPHMDYRGEMWTYWENSYETPKEKISKFTRSRKNVLEVYTETTKLGNTLLVCMVKYI
tara:strand:- start:2734 stop:2970 length:237 start_codon:yes stop_codon:yes gene_type:complete